MIDLRDKVLSGNLTVTSPSVSQAIEAVRPVAVANLSDTYSRFMFTEGFYDYQRRLKAERQIGPLLFLLEKVTDNGLVKKITGKTGAEIRDDAGKNHQQRVDKVVDVVRTIDHKTLQIEKNVHDVKTLGKDIVQGVKTLDNKGLQIDKKIIQPLKNAKETLDDKVYEKRK